MDNDVDPQQVADLRTSPQMSLQIVVRAVGELPVDVRLRHRLRRVVAGTVVIVVAGHQRAGVVVDHAGEQPFTETAVAGVGFWR